VGSSDSRALRRGGERCVSRRVKESTPKVPEGKKKLARTGGENTDIGVSTFKGVKGGGGDQK